MRRSTGWIALGCTLWIAGARADPSYKRFPIDALERKAQADQAEFEREFELYDEAPATSDPDWRSLLRPSVRIRVTREKYRTWVPRVDYGVVFSGPSTYQESPDASIAPASTSKLFTAAFALKHLGPEYVFENRLVWTVDLDSKSAEKIELIGSGDPSFGSIALGKLFDEMIGRLRAYGIRRVVGPILFRPTDPRWQLRVRPDGWKTTDSLPLDAFGLVSQASALRILTAKLRHAGLVWVAEDVPRERIHAVEESATYRSEPLKMFLQPFMLRSINVFGEALLRKVGELKGASDAENLHLAGLALLQEYASAAVHPHPVHLNDGSGLSRTSRVSAAALTQFLEGLKSETYFPELFASLPVAGRTGTLESRMRSTRAEGRIHAKTGSIDGHYQLAGYVVDDRRGVRDYHPFVILTRTETRYGAYCRATQDKVLARLAEF